MRATLSQIERWRQELAGIHGKIEATEGERGPSKLENLVWYAIEEADDEIKRLSAPAITP